MCNSSLKLVLTHVYIYVVLADVGLKWSELKKTLNPKYNWKAAIQAAMGNNVPLKKVYKQYETCCLVSLC